ncbi:MAG TPA: PSD1 and planctomycete cytochrome C domain-containing protein [Verrucomicrobiales bacterium]|nr:PSD1 and planctomycete cytochrome C domain-containing protein [Verrucomicrobiales bacterium]
MLRFLPVSIPARRAAGSLLAMGLAAVQISSAATAEVSFNRDIRPILSENCYSCHGPDKRARKAERRIDNAEGAYAEHEGTRAFVPGDPAKSDAWARVSSVETDDDHMPPSKSGKKLKPEQIALLKKWIEEGAKYESHWSFIPPKRPEVPHIEGRKAEIRNPIDAFLLARLANEDLTFSPEAEKTTLIRRATYDLTGLPPTPAEVDAFLADTSANAYGKLIDRLLASPLYGEKMAVPWLDLSRYADTHGYHLDAGREQWPWRDWVISAFNRNLPFDQFVEWQLAGDLLPDATTEQKLATGFVRNNMINFEGGAIPEEYLAAYIKDRVNTTGTVFLGLTVGCAECHDHKFDPFTQRDFYQLYAYFNSVPENGLDGSKGNAAPLLHLPATAEEAKKIEDLTVQIAAAEKHLTELGTQTEAAQAAWEKAITEKTAQWTVLKPESARADGGTELAVQPDGSLLARGANPATNVYEITAPAGANLTGLRLEALTDPSLAGQGPGRASNGNFVMSGIELAVASAAKPEDFTGVKLVRAQADYEQANYSVAGAIDGDSKSGWAVDGNTRHEHRTAWFEAEKPFGFPGGTLVRVRLRFESPVGTHAIGRPRLAVTGDTPVFEKTKLPPDLAKILAMPDSRRDEGQRKKLRTYYREKVSPALREPAAQIAKLREELAAEKKRTPTVMVMQQMEKPRDTFILTRGQYDQHGEKVQPAVPASLGAQKPDAPKNRLGLARWLIDPQHPLMARVSVNRFWKNIMGTGIVKTVNDFGSQGEWPKHPELLDWLAVEFRESGWDVKHMVRLIVTSAAYRQSSKVTPELLERDPDNRLLARGPRFRLAAEEVRDTALAVSGLLTGKIGGPSVLPYQPAGLWEDLNSRTDSRNWSAQFFVQSHGEDLYRRSLYTFWKRTSPPPQMLTFDAPDREVCTANRERTNTPLQALVTLNDPQFVEASRKFAERMMREGGETSADRVKFAFRIATARAPNDHELTMLLSLFEKAKVRYSAQPEQAMKLLNAGEAKRDESLDVTELAAWTMVASTILNLDETITKG